MTQLGSVVSFDFSPVDCDCNASFQSLCGSDQICSVYLPPMGQWWDVGSGLFCNSVLSAFGMLFRVISTHVQFRTEPGDS